MKVTARFYSSEQLLPVHLLVINWTDKKQVRMELGSALQPYPVYWNPHNAELSEPPTKIYEKPKDQSE